MQLKSITATAVLLLVVASLSVAGCTTTTTSNSPNQPSTAHPTGGRSELLQAIVAQENKTAGRSWEDYKVTWLNNTAVNVYGVSNGSYVLYTNSYTFTQFPTIAAASAYFDSKSPVYNFTKPEQVPDAGLYMNAAPNQHPTVLKAVTKLGTVKVYNLEQIDALIIDWVSSSKSVNQA